MQSLANQKSVFANDGFSKHLPTKAKSVAPTTWRDELARAEQSLSIIENMLDAEEQHKIVKNKGPMRKRRYKRCKSFVIRNGLWITTFLLTVAVLISTLWLRFYRTRACSKGSDITNNDPSAAEVVGEALAIDSECYILVFGAPMWQWTLWLSLWMPLGWAASLLLNAAEWTLGKMTALSGNVIFFVLSLHEPAWRLLRAVFWLLAWIIICERASSRSKTCNNARDAGDEIPTWCRSRSPFEAAYRIVIKVVAALVVYCGSTVLREAVVKWLSLRFHHRQQLQQMTDALVKEHLVKLLTKPLGYESRLDVGDLQLDGFNKAHAAALSFCLDIQHGHLMRTWGQDVPAAALKSLTLRAQSIAQRLVLVLTDAHNKIVLDYHEELALDPHLSGKLERARTDHGTPKHHSINLRTRPGKGTGFDSLPEVRTVDSEEVLHHFEMLCDGAASPVNLHPVSGIAQVVEMRRRARLWKHRTPQKKMRPKATEAPSDVKAAAYSAVLLNQTSKIHPEALAELSETFDKPGAYTTVSLSKQIAKMEDYMRSNFLSVDYLSHLNNSGSGIPLASMFSSQETSQIDNSLEARKLGYYLFWNLKQGRHSFVVTEDDINALLNGKDTDQRDQAWRMLDKDSDGAISMQEVMEATEDVYQRRKNLARTLLDHKSVVNQVGSMVGAALWVAMVFIFVAIYDTSLVRTTWTALSASLLSFSFIFGNSIRQVWESGVFLFGVHPFDVGDVIKLDDNQYTVDKVALMFVSLVRTDNARVTMPMEKVRQAMVHNVSRSGNMWDSFKVYVDMDTPADRLSDVAEVVKAHITDNPHYFGGMYRVYFTKGVSQHKLEMSVFFDFATNGTNLMCMGLARTGLFAAIARVITATEVEYTLPAQKMLPGQVSVGASGGLPRGLVAQLGEGFSADKDTRGGGAAGSGQMAGAAGAAALMQML